MELSEKVENIGGAGGSAYGGAWMCLLIIFLIILYAMHRDNRGHEGGFRHEEGCADKLTWSRYANYVDPEMCELRRDQAVDTGEIKCAIDGQTGTLLLNQEKIARDQERLMQDIARDQERYFFQAQINQKDEKLADQREKVLMMDNALQNERLAREADRRQAELMNAFNNQFCLVNNRITGIEGNMLKAPQFYPYGGIQTVSQCGYLPCSSAAPTGCGSYA